MNELKQFLPNDLFNLVCDYSNPTIDFQEKQMRKIVRKFKKLKKLKLYYVVQQNIHCGEMYTDLHTLNSEVEDINFSSSTIIDNCKILKNRKEMKKINTQIKLYLQIN
jgi:hypothetical protein